MQYFGPQEYLKAIWEHMTQGTRNSAELATIRGMFIVLGAKNIKLETRSLIFQGSRSNIIS